MEGIVRAAQVRGMEPASRLTSSGDAQSGGRRVIFCQKTFFVERILPGSVLRSSPTGD